MAIEFVFLWTEDNNEDLSVVVERVCHLIGQSMMIPKLNSFQRNFTFKTRKPMRPAEVVELLNRLEARRDDAYAIIACAITP